MRENGLNQGLEDVRDCRSALPGSFQFYVTLSQSLGGILATAETRRVNQNKDIRGME